MRTAMLMIMALCMLFVISVVAKEEVQEKKVKILFTHDMHSHLDTFTVKKKGKSVERVGGFARLKTKIDEKRGEDPELLLVDGGDFSMGTLYQTITESEAAELTLMGEMGYDAVTLGNHEFDYKSSGLVNMLSVAKRKQESDPSVQLPHLVSAGIDWERNDSDENRELKQALEDYGSTPYLLLEKNGIKIGIYGVMGREAQEYAPESGVKFDHIVDTSKRITKQLKDEGAELIICLSHSGTNEDRKKSEDETLAKKVPDIDVIVSAHTHTKLKHYMKSGDTYIVSCGRYGEFLGELDLTKTDGGRWAAADYELNHLDDSVEEDETVAEKLAQYKKIVDRDYLRRFGYTFDEVLADNQVEFTQMDDFAQEVEEDPLGNLITDSYIYAVRQAEGEDYEPVTAAFTPAGTIRATLPKGKITVSDVFNVCSLGVGADGIAGYPLVGVYLTGKELKEAAEMDVSVSPFMKSAQLYASGIRWTFNSNRLPLNKVIKTDLQQETLEAIEDKKLYRVVAGLYVTQMLGSVEDASMGLLKIEPKDKTGQAIEDFTDYIVRDENEAEVKEWCALASYLQSFEKNEAGLPEVPDIYASSEGRKVDIDSKNLKALVSRPNKFAAGFYTGAAALTVCMALLVRSAIKCYTKKRSRKRKR